MRITKNSQNASPDCEEEEEFLESRDKSLDDIDEDITDKYNSRYTFR